MLPLIKINLLPYREEQTARQKLQFRNIVILGAAIGVGLSVLGYLALAQRVSAQESRNQTLEAGAAALDKDVAEIKKLKAERDAFLQRKDQVEKLESRRFGAARIVDTLNSILPDGLYLTSISADSNQEAGLNGNLGASAAYTINGKAVTEAKVAQLMKKLTESGLFASTDLLSIKSENNTQNFSLKAFADNPVKEGNSDTAADADKE